MRWLWWWKYSRPHILDRAASDLSDCRDLLHLLGNCELLNGKQHVVIQTGRLLRLHLRLVTLQAPATGELEWLNTAGQTIIVKVRGKKKTSRAMKVEMFRRCFVSLICDSRLSRTKKDFRNFLRTPKINTAEGIQRRRSGFTLHGSICHWRRRPQQKATNMRGRTYGKWFVLQTELFSRETGTA